MRFNFELLKCGIKNDTMQRIKCLIMISILKILNLYIYSSNIGKYLSLLTVVVLIASIIIGTNNPHGTRSTTTVFLHLLSFAAHFGAQCWVTFIAGTFFNRVVPIMSI